MKLFGKKETEKTCCCEQRESTSNATQTSVHAGSVIKVLGSGCAKCVALEQAVKEAIAELGLSLEVEHVSDFVQIASYGVMSTPALVVDEKVVAYGKVLNVEEIKTLLK